MEAEIHGGMRAANAKGISEVSNITYNDSDLDKMLNKYGGHEGKYTMKVTVIVAKNGPDGATKAGGRHSINVVGVTEDTVYIENSWHPDKIEPIPRREFEKMAIGLTANWMDPDKVTNTYITNSINSIQNGSANSGNIPQEQLNSLQNLMGKIHATHFNNGNTVPQRISPNKLNALIASFNNSHSTNVNMNNLLRTLNNVSGATLNQQERASLERILSSLSDASKENVDDESNLKILQDLIKKYNK